MTQQPTAALELLLPIVATHRYEADKNRQLSNHVFEAVCDSGLLGMSVAPAHGGLGTDLPNMLQIYEAIAYEDAAVSWIVWNAALIGFYARFMSQALREELFTDRDKLVCQSTIPAGELDLQNGKNIVRGRWPLMSGSPGAHWAVLSCRRMVNGQTVVDASGAPEIEMVAIPRASFEIIDTWHSSGLRGTGSNDIEVVDIVAPKHRIFSLSNKPQITSPTDRLPIFASISAIFAAQTLGVARAVFDYTLERGRTIVTPGPMPDPRDRLEFQIAIAKQGEVLTLASERLTSAAHAVWAHADSGEAPDPKLSTDLYATVFFVIDAAKVTVNTLHELNGTSGLYENSPIEKPARDLHAMLRHIVAQPFMHADVGRVRLGLDPQWPLFFV